MRKIILAIIILSFLFGATGLAQGIDLSSPGINPDSTFYFFDSMGEKIGMFFTFGAEKKAAKAIRYAEEKMAEAKAMAEKNNIEALERASQHYKKFLDLANTKTKEAEEKGKDVEELAILITEKILNHQEVLIEVFEKVPEQARAAIEKALEVSRKGLEEAVKAVSGDKREELFQKIEETKRMVEDRIKILEEKLEKAEGKIQRLEERLKGIEIPEEPEFKPIPETEHPAEPLPEEPEFKPIPETEHPAEPLPEEPKPTSPPPEEEPSAPEPFLTIVSPNGGEVLGEGQNYTIQWESSGLKPNEEIIITIFREDGLNGSIATVSASQNSYLWKVETEIGGWAFGYLRLWSARLLAFISGQDLSYKYTITIYASQSYISDRSDDYFTVVKRTAPDLTLGEEIKIFSDGFTVTVCNQGTEDLSTEKALEAEIEIYRPWMEETSPTVTKFLEILEAELKINECKTSRTVPYSEFNMEEGIYYRVQVHVDPNNYIDELTEGAGRVYYFTVPTKPNITVTSPNGGEVWQLYNTHKITWTPDPDSGSVLAYLEKMQQGTFVTVGKITPLGKGSIQWDGAIDTYVNYPSPGDYYVRLVNTQTNVTDRSDGPFRLVAANEFVKVALKVKSADGVYSDGPITVETRTIQVLWSSNGADACTLHAYSTDTRDYTPLLSLPSTAGERQLILPGDSVAYYVSLRCQSSLYGGNTSDDSVSVNVHEEVCSLPETPVLTDPGISVNKHEPFTLNWTTVSGAKWYALQNDTIKDFSTGPPPWICQVNSDTDNPGVGTSLPKVTTIYYYRVKACNDCGCGPYSNVVNMEVIVPPPIVDTLKFLSAECTYNEECASNTCVRGRESVVGVCSEKYTGESCVDEDSGDYYAKGTVFGLSNVGIGWDKTIYEQITDICSKDVKGNDPGLKSIFEYKCMYYGGRNIFTSISYDCPNSCQDGACLSDITVISPNGEEVWVEGETHRINWNFVGVDSVGISIKDPSLSGDGLTNYITEDHMPVPASPGYYDWTIPPLGQIPINEGDGYKIIISDFDNPEIKDESNNFFSIIRPSLTITSPSGGEEWVEGKINRITWESVNIEKINVIKILMGGQIFKTISDIFTANPGHYDWTISSDFPDFPPASNYRIYIGGTGYDNRLYGDHSDGYFSIAPP